MHSTDLMDCPVGDNDNDDTMMSYPVGDDTRIKQQACSSPLGCSSRLSSFHLPFVLLLLSPHPDFSPLIFNLECSPFIVALRDTSLGSEEVSPSHRPLEAGQIWTI